LAKTVLQITGGHDRVDRIGTAESYRFDHRASGDAAVSALTTLGDLGGLGSAGDVAMRVSFRSSTEQAMGNRDIQDWRNLIVQVWNRGSEETEPDPHLLNVTIDYQTYFNPSDRTARASSRTITGVSSKRLETSNLAGWREQGYQGQIAGSPRDVHGSWCAHPFAVESPDSTAGEYIDKRIEDLLRDRRRDSEPSGPRAEGEVVKSAWLSVIEDWPALLRHPMFIALVQLVVGGLGASGSPSGAAVATTERVSASDSREVQRLVLRNDGSADGTSDRAGEDSARRLHSQAARYARWSVFMSIRGEVMAGFGRRFALVRRVPLNSATRSALLDLATQRVARPIPRSLSRMLPTALSPESSCGRSQPHRSRSGRLDGRTR